MIGMRILRRTRKVDPKVVAAFREIPVANISDSMHRSSRSRTFQLTRTAATSFTAVTRWRLAATRRCAPSPRAAARQAPSRAAPAPG